MFFIRDGITSTTLRGIRKGYGSTLFSLHIDKLEFHNRNIHVIVGPNGSGKSTLLRLIGLLDKPDAGEILFNNNAAVSENNGHVGLRKRIGFLMQNPYLFNMDVFNNIGLGLKIRRYPRKKIVSKVEDMMAILNIQHLARRSVKDLSRGEYQKVAIAQVLVLRPELILMDEPVANIDAESTLSIEETVKDIQRRFNTIVIMTTHSLSQAYRMSGHIISVREGKVIDFVPA